METSTSTLHYEYNGITKNEIHFIMIRKNLKKLVRNVEVLNRFEFNSDLKMVRLKMTLEVVKPRRKFIRRKIIVTKDEAKIRELQSRADEEIKKSLYTMTTHFNINMIQ